MFKILFIFILLLIFFVSPTKKYYYGGGRPIILDNGYSYKLGREGNVLYCKNSKCTPENKALRNTPFGLGKHFCKV